MSDRVFNRAEIETAVRDALANVPIIDMHTHLYPPAFGTTVRGSGPREADPAGLCLWGIDELLTYHYLIAEVFRVVPPSRMPFEQFWRMSQREKADHIWKHLFVERAPISEACRGVLTAISKLGMDPSDSTLDRWRAECERQDPDRYIDRIMQAANVTSITMTNNVFDDNERNRWLADPGVGRDPRFRAALRVDPLLNAWPAASQRLREWGYRIDDTPTADTMAEVRRFLCDWLDRTRSIYLAVSLPPTWRFAEQENADVATRLLCEALLPVCAERNLPLAMMIGAVRAINPQLGDAGDGMGRADVDSLCQLCRAFPENRFLVTLLSRENQHELAVASRKFPNLTIFGCWWFVNNPSLIEEITRMRIELLGTSFIPQHSDARVMDQLLYKWEHSRAILAKVLVDKFTDLANTGRPASRLMINETAKQLLSTNFKDVCTC